MDIYIKISAKRDYLAITDSIESRSRAWSTLVRYAAISFNVTGTSRASLCSTKNTLKNSLKIKKMFWEEEHIKSEKKRN